MMLSNAFLSSSALPILHHLPQNCRQHREPISLKMCYHSYPLFSIRRAEIFAQSAVKQAGEQDETEDIRLLTAVKTNYNDILILETPKSRMLLLDSTRNYVFAP